jgi:hypothetical protein
MMQLTVYIEEREKKGLSSSIGIRRPEKCAAHT